MQNLIIPKHIGIIPDGNRRWARSKGLKPWEGHREGAKRVEEIIRACAELGVEKLSIYTLSTDNAIKRPKDELRELFRILKEFLERWERGEFDDVIERYEVRVRFLGKYRILPKPLVRLMNKIMRKTAKHQKRVLNFLIGYSGTYELLQAIKKIAKHVKEDRIKIRKLDENKLKEYLFVPDDLDLIIRTGGYSRLSDFMLLQARYAEFYVTKKYWPEFTKKDLMKAIRWFNSIQRNFGR
ncbi:MAG: di-trans,poly-cis-decaprenylcistransferase [Candidatus Aenigmarchaeota archaeon]|nr:di-trans,poly-cis-decaprenylcistransferase [Candidatus Aenigmarchaeota archaeon]